MSTKNTVTIAAVDRRSAQRFRPVSPSPRVELAPLPSAERRVREETAARWQRLFRQATRTAHLQRGNPTYPMRQREAIHTLASPCISLMRAKGLCCRCSRQTGTSISGTQRLPSAAAGSADGATRLQGDDIGGRSRTTEVLPWAMFLRPCSQPAAKLPSHDARSIRNCR